MYSFQFIVWALEDTVKQYHFAIATYLLFFHTMLVIHEGSHAATGALLGLRSTGVRIGDKPLFTISVLHYAVTLGWKPTSGHTYFVDEENFPDTWQVLATYLAGPLAVVFAGPVFFLLFRHSHLRTAAVFGVLFSFCGVYDLRKGCPDGKAIRRLWKILRSDANSMGVS
jgi:hypothetical protein